MKVKICGITNKSDAFAAVDYGADAIGFILYPKSRRYIEPAKAVELARQIPPYIQRVAVTVDMPVKELLEIDETRAFDVWQLHGSEKAGYCAQLKPLRRIKALGLPLLPGIKPSEYDVDAFLLDKLSPDFGGTGETFDWNLARMFKLETNKTCVLSGGLNVDNVLEAIEAVSPHAVDVCSGVEESDGIKNHHKLKEFIGLCRKH